MANNYKVNVEALLVPKAIAELDDGNGNITYEHKNVTYYYGEAVPRDEISPEILDALDEADENNKLYQSLRDKLVPGEGSDALSVRLGVPFAGYDDLDEDEVINLFRVAPGATVAVAKEYEARNQNRPKVLAYNVGTREGVTDRLDGNLSSERDDPAEKPTADIVTREVSGNQVTVAAGTSGDAPHVTVEAGEGNEETEKSGTASRKPRRRASTSPKPEENKDES
jgi:hypothetical protein